MAEPRASSAGPAPGHVASLLQPLLLERRPAGGREPVESSVLPPNLHLRPGNSEPTVLIYNKFTGGTAAHSLASPSWSAVSLSVGQFS